MGKLEFEFKISINHEKLILLLRDYEGYTEYLPSQLKSVTILEKNENMVKTEEVIVFTSIIKNEIVQQSIHKVVNNLKFITQIISGPAKNSEIIIEVIPINNETKIVVNINLKLSLKARILEPLIKKYYKTTIKTILIRMENKINGCD